MAIAAKVMRMKSASSKRRDFSGKSEKYCFRTYLLALGLNGPEFKTARRHLLPNLSGSAAWVNDRPEVTAPVLAEAA